MADPLAGFSSRNYDRTRGPQFRDRLDLPDWHERSVWGYDEGAQSFCAWLWRNGNRLDDPDISLPRDLFDHRWPGCLALDIIAATGQSHVAVVTAMAVLRPSPRLRSRRDIKAELGGRPGACAEFRDGYRRALMWLIGEVDTCPGSRTSWPGGAPTAQLADVEHELLVGRMYSHDVEEILNQPFSGGGESTLWWALGG